MLSLRTTTAAYQLHLHPLFGFRVALNGSCIRLTLPSCSADVALLSLLSLLLLL